MLKITDIDNIIIISGVIYMGSYEKYYVGRCIECDKEKFVPVKFYKVKGMDVCEYCGGKVHIDMSDIVLDKK